MLKIIVTEFRNSDCDPESGKGISLGYRIYDEEGNATYDFTAFPDGAPDNPEDILQGISENAVSDTVENMLWCAFLEKNGIEVNGVFLPHSTVHKIICEHD